MSPTLLNTRELSKSTARVLRDLPKTGPRLITRDGQTVGILIPPSEAGIEADIDLLNRLRLAQALASIQRDAVLARTDGLTMAEIDAEIAATRASRRQTRPSRHE